MNYYEILGVKKTATNTEIKNAYKQLVKKYHPDIYIGDKHFAERKIKEINNAYDTLSDEKLKKEYDESINPTPTYTYNTDFDKYTTSYNYSSRTYSNNYHSQKTSTTYSSNSSKKYNQYDNPFYNANYKNSQKNYDDIIYEKIDKLTLKAKITFVFVVIFLFLLFFLFSVIRWYLLISKPNDYEIDTNNSSYENSINNKIYQQSPQTPNENYTTPKRDNDDSSIYDYFTESDLRDMYNSYFYYSYDSYEEFKREISKYMKENGY